MRRLLAEKFISQRQRLGLDIRTVASLAGYSRKIAKGVRRIERFERGGDMNNEFIARLFATVGLDVFSVEQEIVLALASERERQVETWLREHRDGAVAERMMIRCFSGVYSTVALPGWITKPAEAATWARSFAMHHGHCVCL